MQGALTAALLLGATLVPSAVAAQEQPAEAPEEPVEVRIVGDKADAIQKIPGSTTVIGKEEIDDAQPANAGELLRRIPGLNVREDTAGGGRLDIGIRGLDPGRSRRLLVLEDGVPLAINPYAEPDLYFPIQIERVNRIEVLKGSGSILFGPQTIGGVVNFSTYTPPYKTESYVSLEAGENGYGRAIARFGTAIPTTEDQDPVRVLGEVVVKGSQGPRDQPYRDHDAMFKIAFPTGARSQATVKVAGHHTTAVSEDVGLTRGMFEAEPNRPTVSPDSRMNLSRFDGVVTHEADFGHGFSLKTLAYGTFTTRIWGRQEFDRIAAPGVRYVRILGDVDLPFGAMYFRDAARVLDRTYWVAGLEPRLTARFSTGVVVHTLDTGLRVLVEGASLDELEAPSSRSLEGELSASEGHKSVAFATYIQDRMAFRPWLVVTPGVRLEVAHYIRSVALTANGEPGGDGSSDVVAPVPGLGVTLGIPEIHGFAGIHLGFAPPRATSAIGAKGQSELLDAERSTNYEVGLRTKPAAWLSSEGTFFFQRFTNQIVPNTTTTGGVELVNGGATRSLGGELSAKVEIGRAVKRDFELDAGARGGILRATFEGGNNAGKSLPYAPMYTISATLDGGVPSIGLFAGAALTYVGPQYADDENTVLPDASGRVGEIPAYTLLDFTLRYEEHHSGAGVFASAKSVFDHPVIIARRPEGIFTTGFRQINVGLSYTLK